MRKDQVIGVAGIPEAERLGGPDEAGVQTAAEGVCQRRGRAGPLRQGTLTKGDKAGLAVESRVGLWW